VDPRAVEGIGAVVNLQEPRAVLEGLFPDARNLAQGRPRAYGTVGLAIIDNVLGGAHLDAAYVAQQFRRRLVYVDGQPVHAGLDRPVQSLAQTPLVHVVLVLAYADVPRFELHQLGERILQAPRHGNSATRGRLEVRQFFPRQLRDRIYGQPGLIHEGEGRPLGETERAIARAVGPKLVEHGIELPAAMASTLYFLSSSRTLLCGGAPSASGAAY